ncbi:MAG: carboxypeptidase-like regulatory domain-containing protein [Blastocatellia bacterium]|nr:carboxypeptidase-like regulatory domain-containing protein [Blastocatellia bacterium]
MTSLKIPAAVGLLLLTAMIVRAQTPGPAIAYGAITGRVTCEDGPVPFASVTVIAGGRDRGIGSRTVIADIEGNFKVDGLRAAALFVTASAPGYVQESASPAEGDESTPAVPQTYYHIGDNVTIRLTKGGVITGRVLNPAGDPVIGVRVVAQSTGPPSSGFPGTGGSEAQTDDRGVYRIYGLPAGAYVVAASAAAGNGPGGGFGGGGRGGFQRSPFANNAPVYYPSGSRANAAEVAVTGGGESNGIDIQYRSQRGAAVSGTVAGASTEAGREFTVVTLAHKASGQVVNTAFLAPRGGLVRRGASPDSFTIIGVADGEYELTAHRNAGEDAAASAPVRVLVNGSDISGLTLALKPLASLRVRLQVESGIKCAAPRPATFEEQVFALRPDPANQSRPLVGVPDRAGAIAFRGVPAGRYRLNAHLLDEGWFVRSIAAPAAAPSAAKPATATAPKMMEISRTGLALKSGDRLTGVVVALSEGAAALDGKVSKTGPRWRVHLVPVERERIEDVLRYAETLTGDNGAFRLRNLAPGKYWVLAPLITSQV